MLTLALTIVATIFAMLAYDVIKPKLCDLGYDDYCKQAQVIVSPTPAMAASPKPAGPTILPSPTTNPPATPTMPVENCIFVLVPPCNYMVQDRDTLTSIALTYVDDANYAEVICVANADLLKPRFDKLDPVMRTANNLQTYCDFIKEGDLLRLPAYEL